MSVNAYRMLYLCDAVRLDKPHSSPSAVGTARAISMRQDLVLTAHHRKCLRRTDRVKYEEQVNSNVAYKYHVAPCERIVGRPPKVAASELSALRKCPIPIYRDPTKVLAQHTSSSTDSARQVDFLALLMCDTLVPRGSAEPPQVDSNVLVTLERGQMVPPTCLIYYFLYGHHWPASRRCKKALKPQYPPPIASKHRTMDLRDD